MKTANDEMHEQGSLNLSYHAFTRVHGRRLGEAAVAAALNYGREVYAHGAIYYVIGRNEVRAQARRGVDLRAFEGVHVVCSHDGVVLTAFRNRDLRVLKPRWRHQH